MIVILLDNYDAVQEVKIILACLLIDCHQLSLMISMAIDCLTIIFDLYGNIRTLIEILF